MRKNTKIGLAAATSLLSTIPASVWMDQQWDMQARETIRLQNINGSVSRSFANEKLPYPLREIANQSKSTAARPAKEGEFGNLSERFRSLCKKAKLEPVPFLIIAENAQNHSPFRIIISNLEYIGLPFPAFGNLKEDEQNEVLMHEIIHIKLRHNLRDTGIGGAVKAERDAGEREVYRAQIELTCDPNVAIRAKEKILDMERADYLNQRGKSSPTAQKMLMDASNTYRNYKENQWSTRFKSMQEKEHTDLIREQRQIRMPRHCLTK